MKVLMISYTSLIQELYHGKPRAIAALPEVELRVLVPPYWKELWSGGRKNLEVTSSEKYRISIEPALFPGNLHLAFFRRGIGKLIREWRPDIIDVEDETFNAGSAQVVWLRNRFCPTARIVMHASQSDFKSYPPPFNWFERYALKNVSAFLARNSEAIDVLRKKGYTGRAEVITHGVDPSVFAGVKGIREELGVSGKSVVGYVGALVPHKGLDLLLKAAQPLDVMVLLVGGGEAEPALRSQAAELGMSDRVRFVPPVQHGRVPALLASMDLFVLPSRTVPNWRERFGRVLIEAMAAGVPVIGSSSGEIPSVIGRAGRIFAEGDATALRTELDAVLRNPAERLRLQKEGRARVEQEYSWDVIAKRTFQIYTAVHQTS